MYDRILLLFLLRWHISFLPLTLSTPHLESTYTLLCCTRIQCTLFQHLAWWDQIYRLNLRQLFLILDILMLTCLQLFTIEKRIFSCFLAIVDGNFFFASVTVKIEHVGVECARTHEVLAGGAEVHSIAIDRVALSSSSNYIY